MHKKILIGLFLILPLLAHSKNPVERFYDAFNKKDWVKFKKLLHKDFRCIPDPGVIPASREEFYNNIYAEDVWFAEWKILSMAKISPRCYLVKGTFTDEYSMWLYGAPVEGQWIYCCKNNKIISLDWLQFPPNPNQTRGDRLNKEFMDWIALNYPDYAGLSKYWSHDAAILFRDLFRKYKKEKD